jgi:phosphocarrier protein
MIRKKLQIINKLGLHARAAAKLVQTASKFASEIEISLNGKTANGKSIMGVMMLAASQSTWIDIQIHGQDEDNAIEAIAQLIANRFGEEK